MCIRDSDVAVPFTATTDQTFARFRWSTTSGLDTTTTATDGEVEDYAVTIASPAPLTAIPASCSAPVPLNLAGVVNGQELTNADLGIIIGSTTLESDAGSPGFPAGDAAGNLQLQYRDNGVNSDGYSIQFAQPVQIVLSQADTGGTNFNNPERWTVTATGGTLSVADPGRPDRELSSISGDGTSVVSFVPTNPGNQFPPATSNWQVVSTLVTAVRLDLGPATIPAAFVNNASPIKISICGTDHADAPGFADAPHFVQSDILLGVAVDAEGVGLSSADADGDDNLGPDDDEDGITIPALTQGQTATITADVTGAGGFLQGWIDFDGNGAFDAGEQVATDLQDDGADDDVTANDGVITFDVDVPVAATTDQTFARFRWSTTAGLDATTPAPDGEVEDYAVTLAPATDPGGPSGVCPFVTDFDGLTPEYNSTPFYALGQNLNGQHVENTGNILSDSSGSGRFLFHNTSNAPTGQTTDGESWGTATPANVEPNTNYVFTFQMANQNGTRRQIIQPQINGVDVGGTFTTSSVGVWETFEVVWSSGAATTADLSLVQTREGTSGTGLDWGFDEISLCPALDQSDAPDSFPAAAHAIAPDFRLGAAIDGELAGGSPDASGDGADDDGITFPVLTRGQTVTITADVTGAGGFLQGWIDFDGSGTFEAGEQIAADLQDGDGDGEISIPVTVPSNAVAIQTFARFRWSTTNGLDATTTASDGEVEDYAVTPVQTTFPPPASCGVIFTADIQANNAGWTYIGPTSSSRPLRLSTGCLLYTSPSPRDQRGSRMPSSA